MSLFAHYPADPMLIRACAGDLFAGSSRIGDVAATVTGRHVAAVAAVGGVLVAPLSSAVLPVSQAARSLSAAATVAGGALRLFAAAVATYNAGVDELNRRYDAARAAGFYAEPITAPPGESLTAVDERRYDDRISEAKTRLVFELGLQEARLRADLDAAAETAAAVLDRGPTPDSMRFLSGSKGLPAATGLVFSGVGSDDDDHTELWAPGPIEGEMTVSDEDDDGGPSLADWLRVVPAAVDVGTGLLWQGVKDGADRTWDGVTDGADWAWGGITDGADWAWGGITDGADWAWSHGGEAIWNFGIGDAINTCREDVTSAECVTEGILMLPWFKVGKAAKTAKKLEEAGDDVRDIEKTLDKADDPVLPQAPTSHIDRGDLSVEEMGNLTRYEKKLPAAAEATQITRLGDGSVQFLSKVPGRVPGSYAEYAKTLDSSGTTIAYTKTTYGPDGTIIHVKDKMSP